MTTHSNLRQFGFTILESCLMLALLTAFCMVTFAVIQKGPTSVPDSGNPEWQKKGGDESMSTSVPMSGSAILLPEDQREQTGLGSGMPARPQPTEKPRAQ